MKISTLKGSFLRNISKTSRSDYNSVKKWLFSDGLMLIEFDFLKSMLIKQPKIVRNYFTKYENFKQKLIKFKYDNIGKNDDFFIFFIHTYSDFSINYHSEDFSEFIFLIPAKNTQKDNEALLLNYFNNFLFSGSYNEIEQFRNDFLSERFCYELREYGGFESYYFSISKFNLSEDFCFDLPTEIGNIRFINEEI